MDGQMGSLLARAKEMASSALLPPEVEGLASSIDSEIHCGRTREERVGREEKDPLQVGSQGARC